METAYGGRRPCALKSTNKLKSRLCDHKIRWTEDKKNNNELKNLGACALVCVASLPLNALTFVIKWNRVQRTDYRLTTNKRHSQTQQPTQTQIHFNYISNRLAKWQFGFFSLAFFNRTANETVVLTLYKHCSCITDTLTLKIVKLHRITKWPWIYFDDFPTQTNLYRCTWWFFLTFLYCNMRT